MSCMKNNVKRLLIVGSITTAVATVGWITGEKFGLRELLTSRSGVTQDRPQHDGKGEMKSIHHETSAGVQETFNAASIPAPTDTIVCYATDLFDVWIDPNASTRQHLWEDLDLSTFWQRDPAQLIAWMNQACSSYPSIYEYLERLMLPAAQRKHQVGGLADTKEQHQWLAKFYAMLDHNPQAFVDMLLQSPLARERQNDIDLQEEIIPLSDRYTAWGKLLFYDSDPELRLHYHFCWSNRLFFYFFDTDFKRMRALMDNPANHPVLRVLYANMHWPLVGNGWKAFNRSSLDAVVRESQQGKTIMYLAGGSDIYQLIMSGAYNIYVVDPILPTQSKYCAGTAVMDLLVGEGSQFKVGDVIYFSHGITLTRASFTKNGEPFQAHCADGQDRMIQPSLTVWMVTNEQGDVLGQVTYDRRYCQQSDFAVDKNKVLYMSFNEMYYPCASTKPWGIDAYKFDDDITIYVKQLSRPVNKRIMCNMYQADAAPFQFIKLGSQST